jgi:glycosyltransferase involved in cell wall biosynthesis
MTIGIDARAAAEVAAGRGRVVRELLRALAAREEAHVYRCYARTRWEEPLDARFQWREVAARDPFWHLRAARAAQRECDVFLSCNSYLTPLFMSKPTVPIVYDLIAFDPAMRPNRRSAIVEHLTLGPCVRRAAAVIAISQATADALAARFPAVAARTTVALLGTSSELDEPPPEAPLPEPGFVLAVGTLEPRKNLPRLVAAYRELDTATQLRHPLVVVGALGWETGETLDALHSLGERAILLGHVSNAALAELYRRCAVFCSPSLGEGFGLPVLEAMAAGAAVLTAANSSLPEVGGDAVEYADARDVASIAAGLRRLLDSPALRSELGARARERAKEFSWERFAERTLSVLEQAARGG